ncbi:MAG: ATP-binding protein [Dehalococcoidales bacterium]
MLKNRYLWAVIALVTIFTIYYYSAEISSLQWLSPQDYAGLPRQSFQRALFLIPIFVAAWKLGLRSGIACTIVAGAIMLPLAISGPWRADAVTETAVIVTIGIISTRLVSSLEEARRLQKSFADDLRESNQRLEKEISGRKRAEQRMKEIRDKHETLIGSMPEVVCSRMPDDAATLISISDRWEEWTGYSTHDLYRDGQIWLNSVHSEDRDRVMRMYAVACRDRGNFDCKYRIAHRDTGRIRYVREYGRPVADKNGYIFRFDSVISDITDQKHAEQIKRINNELTASNKEMEAFSYSVSHDLRAPLRSIDGFSQALLEDYSGSLDEQGQDYLNRICAASRRMGQLIDDILKLSRISRAEMQYQEVDLTALAESVLAGLNRARDGRKMELVIAPGLSAVGDSGLIRVALENLLDNALKFTGRQEQARIEFGATRLNGEEVFFVRDDGVGFDMAYADRLFGAFQRLHSQDEFEGTGIGLATVKRIVRRHGGQVWAESKMGKGATFYFSLH